MNPNQWLERSSADISVPQIISARVGEDSISRLIFISPGRGERFYLRALLEHKLAYSYEDVRTIDRVTYQIMQETATLIGIFEKINKAECCLQEAIAFFYTPYHLRFLYAQLIIDIPAHALELWEKCKKNILRTIRKIFLTPDLSYPEDMRDIK